MVTAGEHIRDQNTHALSFTGALQDSDFIGNNGVTRLFGASGVKDVSCDVGFTGPEDVSGDLKVLVAPKGKMLLGHDSKICE